MNTPSRAANPSGSARPGSTEADAPPAWLVANAGQRQWTNPGGAQRNAMTCDVEDYFQFSAFEHLVPKSRWNDFECRIPRNVDRVLELFAAAGISGTFFTLGWVAERYPEVVRRIAEQGHEIASHGMQHVRVWTQRPEEFRARCDSSQRIARGHCRPTGARLSGCKLVYRYTHPLGA